MAIEHHDPGFAAARSWGAVTGDCGDHLLGGDHRRAAQVHAGGLRRSSRRPLWSDRAGCQRQLKIDPLTARRFQRAARGSVFTCRRHGSRWLATAMPEGYNEFPDYGIIELIPVGGRTDHWEIVGTPLHNWGFPLFRYRTGDEVRPSPLGPCSCGRAFRLLGKIDGRVEDTFIAANGQVLPSPDCGQVPCRAAGGAGRLAGAPVTSSSGSSRSPAPTSPQHRNRHLRTSTSTSDHARQ
jgi:hypothetical protein